MKTSNPPFSTPTHDEIAERAREIWILRGSPVGQDSEIWYEAERQLIFAKGSGRSPAPAPISRRPARTTNAGKVADPDIDDNELEEKLDEKFKSAGAAQRRSPTSL
jgi:hypothetical protein